MKKNTIGFVRLFTLMFLAFGFVLFTTGCEPEPNNTKTEAGWLAGKWVNKTRGTEFTVSADLAFVCDLDVLEDVRGRVYGNLDIPPEGIGSPDDYILKNMKGAQDGDPGNDYTGNGMLRLQVPQFNNIIVTLEPNNEKTEFIFSTTNGAAQIFFGGTYSREP